MDDDLDLQKGRSDDEPKGVTSRTERRHRAKDRQESDALTNRLSAILARIAESLEGREEFELAEVIREDSRAMVGGLVSLTRRVPAAAGALIAALSVVEPLIAFGRVFRVMLRRIGNRRADAVAEWERENQERESQDLPPVAAPSAPVQEDAAPIAEPWKLD